MRRTIARILAVLIAGVGVGAFALGPFAPSARADSVGGAGGGGGCVAGTGCVTLQAVSPGTADTGNWSVTGKGIAQGGMRVGPDTTALISEAGGTITTLSNAAAGVTQQIWNTPTITAGAQAVYSWRQAGAEKLNIDGNGNTNITGTLSSTGGATFGGNTTISNFGSLIFGATSGGGVASQIADGATAVGISFSTGTYANPTAKLVNVVNGGTEKFAVDLNGKLIWPTGGTAPVAGRATLVAGTVTVSTTAVTAASIIGLTNCAVNASTALGLPSVSAITAATSFVITARTLATPGTAVAGDVSTICWRIAN